MLKTFGFRRGCEQWDRVILCSPHWSIPVEFAQWWVGSGYSGVGRLRVREVVIALSFWVLWA
jgi:hypothetical protein